MKTNLEIAEENINDIIVFQENNLENETNPNEDWFKIELKKLVNEAKAHLKKVKKGCEKSLCHDWIFCQECAKTIKLYDGVGIR